MDMFIGRKAVIATMHDKEKIIAPILEQHLGVQTFVPDKFDSDAFGTFTREIKRIDNQYKTAKAKIEHAIELTGADIGIASEGSFAPDSEIYSIPANIEIVLLIDKKHNLEIAGFYKTWETNLYQSYVSTVDEIEKFGQKIGFPEHGIILRSDEQNMNEIYKDIFTQEELLGYGKNLLEKSPNATIFLETDMRAHRNPTRQKAIQKATENLLSNIQSLCPRCGSPGFVIRDTVQGLPCQVCRSPTELPLYKIWRCSRCHFELQKPSEEFGIGANPKYCSFCNP